ncbi:MAG: 3-deoxy-D-manno-octulosonic acid transferase [Pseudomonadota bacterium]
MSPLGRAVWWGYGAAGRIMAPLAAPYLRKRAGRGKEDRNRLREKQGHPSAAAPSAPPVWIHGVSVGEALVAVDLARALDGPVLITTGTPTAAERVAALAPDLTHQYAPLDTPPFVDRFLNHWRPRAALFVESDIWPTTVHRLAARSIPIALVNARLSERSFRRWAGRPFLSGPLFGQIDAAIAQSDADAARFGTLGVRKVVTSGNIKFDATPPPADPALVATLREAIGERPVWIAASTHPGEETAAIAAHTHLRAHADTVMLLAPRHPQRGDEVALEAQNAGVVRRRSKGEAAGGDIIVFDTLGELSAAFQVAQVAFMGASLIPLGGHNPAEAAHAGAALVTGRDHGEMFRPFVEANAACVVTDADGLTETLASLMADQAARQRMAGAARQVLAQCQGARARTLKALAPLLDGRPS